MSRATASDSRRSEPPLAVEVERLGSLGQDEPAIDRIAHASFGDPRFSIAAELARPWARVWTAREAGAPLEATMGFVVAWHVADELHVLTIATAPALRRRGVATALMERSLEYAAAERVRLVLLEVRRSNRPALRLYRQLGFCAMGVRPRYYADNGEDAIEMVLALDPSTGRILKGRDEVSA